MVQIRTLTPRGVPRMFPAMNTSHTIARLGDIASIRQGHPFRGAIRAAVDGSVQVIQLKNVGVNGMDDVHELMRTHLSNRKAPDWVKDGDVVLTARGSRPMAALLADPPENTVCSPHLYVIRLVDDARLIPAFLVWQLNQRTAQEHFRRQSAGSRQQSLRKVSVEDLTVQLPSLSRQQQIVAIARSALAERCQCERLMAARQEEVARYSELLLSGKEVWPRPIRHHP